MKVDKDMVTSFLQIQPDNLIRKAALSGKGPESAIWKIGYKWVITIIVIFFFWDVNQR